MAKITVEDCLNVIPNRFDLILIAANRARELGRGEPSIIESKFGEKKTVTALREIATGKFNDKKLKQLKVVDRK